MTPLFPIFLVALIPIIQAADFVPRPSCPLTTQPLGPPTSTNDKLMAVPCYTEVPDYDGRPPTCQSRPLPYYGIEYFETCDDARGFCEFMTSTCAAIVCDGNSDYYCTQDPPGCADCTNIKCVRNQPRNGQIPTDWTDFPLYQGYFYFSYCWQAIGYCIHQNEPCNFYAREIGVYYNALPPYCQNCRR